jgi:hypothetical protein
MRFKKKSDKEKQFVYGRVYLERNINDKIETQKKS